MSSTNESLTLLEKISLLEEKAKKLAQHMQYQSQNEQVLQELADRLSLIAATDESLLLQFQQNMAAFKQFDPNIYQFFHNYQPTRYIVDIVDGFPNILDLQTNQYLYQYPAYLMANIQVESYKKSPQSAAATFDMNEENECGFIHSDTLNQILKVLINRIEQNGSEVRALPKFINSTMVFGVGCGYHLELLSGQHKIKNLFIFEPELDLFYCSLFIANWQQILSKADRCKLNVHISLGEQKDTFFDEILGQSNLYGRYDMAKTFGFIHYNTENIDALIKEFKKRFHETIQGWGFFDDGVLSISHMLTSIKQGVPILKKQVTTHNQLSDYPVFVVGNGPSLDKLIGFIKQYQDKAIIISCGTAMGALYEYGIIPDIHCEQERTFPTVEQMDYYCPPEVFEKVVLFGPSTLHPGVYAKFPIKAMIPKSEEPSAPLLMESKLAHLFEIHNYINPTVSNTAASVALCLGFKNIYFLGVDLAYKQGGSHHSEKSMYYNEDGQDLDLYNSTNQLAYELAGNFGGVFTTDHFFDGSRRMLEKLIAINPASNFYNLSDGALIKGAKPLHLEAVTIGSEPVAAKFEYLQKLMTEVSHQDSGELYDEIYNNLDFAGYKAFCLALIDTIDNIEYNFDSCLGLLGQHFTMLLDQELCPKEHIYQLLKGSVLHMQAMLTRVLYEAVEEADAIEDFQLALSYYRAFLLESISFYQENALKPQYYKTDLYNVLEKK